MKTFNLKTAGLIIKTDLDQSAIKQSKIIFDFAESLGDIEDQADFLKRLAFYLSKRSRAMTSRNSLWQARNKKKIR